MGIQSVRLRGPGKQGIRHSHALALFNLGRACFHPRGLWHIINESHVRNSCHPQSFFNGGFQSRTGEPLTPVGLSFQEASVMKTHPLILFLIVSRLLFFLTLSLLVETLALPPCPLALCLLLLLSGYYYVVNDSCCFPHRSGAFAGPSVLPYASKMRWSPFGFRLNVSIT